MGGSESKMRTYFHKDDYTSFQNLTPPNTIMFTHYNAIEKETKEMVSIFTYGFTEKRGGDNPSSKRNHNKLPEKWIIINALQRLKTLRHPGIIKFKEAILTEAYLYVITEPVVPLARMWNEIPAEEVALGIYSTLKTISFLHSKQLCHNNLQFSSLYISVRERTWLLGGLEYTTPFKDINKSFTSSLMQCCAAAAITEGGATAAATAAAAREIIPPEDFDPNVIPGKVETRDFFALGHLLTVLLSNLVSTSRRTKQQHHHHQQNQQPFDPEVFDWRELQRMADMMVAMSPAKRMTVDQVLSHPVFSKNQFLFVVDHFLKNVRALEPSEKILGFKRIAPLIRKLPASTVTAYILPNILNTELFSEPGIEIVLKDMFSQKTTTATMTTTTAVAASLDESTTMGDLFPASIFVNFVVPFISKNIKRREFDIRRIMLKLYPCYFEELFKADPHHFLTAVMPEILIGLNEKNQEIYIQTLSVLCVTVPQLFTHEFEKSKALSRAISIPSSIQMEAQSRRDYSSKLDNRRYSTGGGSGSGGATSPKRASTTLGGGGGSASGFTPLPAKVIVENFIIPRVLNACVDPQLSTAGNLVLLKRIVVMWKRLCCMEVYHTSLKPVLAQLSQSFKAMLSVLSKDLKYKFVTEILVGETSSNDNNKNQRQQQGEENWMPKILEILLPFLVSSDDHLRTIIADVILQHVTVIAQYPPKQVELDYASPITDRRIDRFGNLIVHTGPRRKSSNSDLNDSDDGNEPDSICYDLESNDNNKLYLSNENLMKKRFPPPALPTKVSFKDFDHSDDDGGDDVDSDDYLPLASITGLKKATDSVNVATKERRESNNRSNNNNNSASKKGARKTSNSRQSAPPTTSLPSSSSSAATSKKNTIQNSSSRDFTEVSLEGSSASLSAADLASSRDFDGNLFSPLTPPRAKATVYLSTNTKTSGMPQKKSRSSSSSSSASSTTTSSTVGKLSLSSLALSTPKGNRMISEIPVPQSWNESILTDSILSALSQESD
ncbi:hypothetical protein BDR26DRAFT_1010801 [Obelidium mucronatum]|nr:hypothetical protein BDR26DRAFT_1010801 [Obelidium mucronatum]